MKVRRVEGADAKEEIEEKMLAAFEKAEVCSVRLELRLNPSEASHQELISLGKAFDLTAKDFFDKSGLELASLVETYQNQRAEVVSRLQAILKAEWVRIKEARV